MNDDRSAAPPALPAASPFLASLGARIVQAADARAEIVLDATPTLANTWGAVHGGVLMTLLDVAMSLAARSTDANAHGAVTVDMSVQFMQPGQGTLRAFGHCAQASRTLAFCDAEVVDVHGDVIARAHGTFKLLRRADFGRR